MCRLKTTCQWLLAICVLASGRVFCWRVAWPVSVSFTVYTPTNASVSAAWNITQYCGLYANITVCPTPLPPAPLPAVCTGCNSTQPTNGSCTNYGAANCTVTDGRSFTCPFFPTIYSPSTHGAVIDFCNWRFHNETGGVPCLNNGTCTSDEFGYMCTCPPLYSGCSCQYSVCSTVTCGGPNSTVCINGTSPSNNTWTPYCNCTYGYSGQYCQNVTGKSDPPIQSLNYARAAVNYCSINDVYMNGTTPCQNNGTCTNLYNGYQCNCTQYWNGTNCTTPGE
jgi:hypothetical protein